MKFCSKKIFDLVNKYGSPIYIFDQAAFEDNYDYFFGCFFNKYSKYKLAYSFKTNYLPYVCKIVHKKGGFAEVVSDMELYIARKCGFNDNEIIYNGPFKGTEKYQFMLNGGILNCDSFDELNDIIEFSKRNKEKILNIGVRVNVDIGQNFISRFGIDECELDRFFALTKESKNVNVIGLHCHVGQSRTVDAWIKRAQIMLSLADKYFLQPPKFIDLGSGMFGELDDYLAMQFGGDLPTYEDYSSAICHEFENHYKNFSEKERPLLITEPGTTLINKYIDFVCTVYSVKKIKDNFFIVVDGSKHNIGDICQLKQLPLNIFRSTNNYCNTIVNDALIVGYTCLEHDVIFKHFSGDIKKGDALVFGNVGGYSNVSKPPFILQNCPMICIDRSGNDFVIKKAETPEYILETYED